MLSPKSKVRLLVTCTSSSASHAKSNASFIVLSTVKNKSVAILTAQSSADSAKPKNSWISDDFYILNSRDENTKTILIATSTSVIAIGNNMSVQTYKAKLFNSGTWDAPATSTKRGLCLSGGGSRALSAGLGQLIGLHNISNGYGGTLLDSVDYISSVSGGTWLTSIFSFSTNQNLDDLLGVYMPPNTLTEKNIGNLSAGSIGHVPSKLSYSGMIDIAHEKIGFKNLIKYPEVRKWVWPVIVGELVLSPYDLYDGEMIGAGKTLTPMPKRFFSLNKAYMDANIKKTGNNSVANGSLTDDDFYFHQSGRPFPIMNTNIKLDYRLSDSALLPVQGTPIAVGATGSAMQSNTSLTADGAVETFAMASSWQSQTSDEAVVNITRRYSLVDLVSCSSAFFAELVGGKIAGAATTFEIGAGFAAKAQGVVSGFESSVLKDFSTLVPQYNYWPVSANTSFNRPTGFADGGDLDNTGLLGMLARSDATSIVVAYNAEIPLGTTENYQVQGYNKKIALVSPDIPILFGYQPKPVNGTYIKFNDSTPSDLKYYEAAQVFSPSEFGPLVSALFAASNGQKLPTVARTRALQVCDNTFAGINNRGRVDVLWLYNNYAEDWVNLVEESSWLLADNIKVDRAIFGTDFYNFPNYNTELQINLNASQVNALAQFQAWVIHQQSEQIKDLFSV